MGWVLCEVAGCGTLGAGCGVWGVGCGVLGAGCRMLVACESEVIEIVGGLVRREYLY